MFKFDEFPEIKKAHEINEQKNDLTYKKEFKFYKFNTKRSEKKWEESINDALYYKTHIYSKIVFDIFSKIRPQLTFFQDEEVHEWDDVFGQNFDALSDMEKRGIAMMIEEEEPYRLPAEYYDERDRMEEKLKGTY